MSFVTVLGLAVAVLVGAPYFAHRLRRKRADERVFPAAHLVPPAPPRARRRSKLEDRALFWTRALSVLALALLGASPLVRCSRLSLHREGGASVALAIVLDDSMSMRAPPSSGSGTRFSRAKDGARELLASMREGDAVALVLAGTPARVALAATTDVGAARAAVEGVPESDRATDLDGAVAMARALVSQLPQVDKRVVVLSDLADGRSDAPPLGAGGDIPVWVPLAELRGEGKDCGVVSADLAGDQVRVAVQCGAGATTAGREVTIRAGDDVVGRAASPTGTGGEVRIPAPAKAAGDLVARLEGSDAIAADDEATVVPLAAAPALAVVADAPDETTVTGGAPIVEQALASLGLDVAVRPIPQLPDRAVDYEGFVGVLVDDPPGLTPEQRTALATFFEHGGEALFALGPRAATAPLGASLEPALAHAVTWDSTAAKGAVKAKGAPVAFADAARSFGDLGARARAGLAPEDAKRFERLLDWDDGAPFAARRAIATGGEWVVTLPFAVNASDVTLRPGFLALLQAWTEDALARAVPVRVDVGKAWTFVVPEGKGRVSVVGPGGTLAVAREGRVARSIPPLVGKYVVTIGETKEVRVAAPVAQEMDLRPRATAAGARADALGDTHSSVDVSWVVALALLGLVAAELGLRVHRARRPEEAAA